MSDVTDRTRPVADVQQLDALEALEHPAHRGPVRRLLDPVWDRLAGGRHPLAYAVLGEPVGEQAQHHDQAEGHDALRLLQEDG